MSKGLLNNMKSWEITAIYLCGYGLANEFKPSEPFFYEFALDERNFTAEYVIHDILPVTTYASLVTILFLLLITDILRYKPIIILGGLATVFQWVFTLWGFEPNRPFTLVRQALQGVNYATGIAYFTYMYANVDHSHYKIVTSYTHVAKHLGKFLGSALGQVFLSTAALNLEDMNYISLASGLLALLMAIFLPPVEKSLYFDGIPNPEDNHQETKSKIPLIKRIIRAYERLFHDIKKAYSNRHVFKWSIWWAIAMAIYLQVKLYIEPLWRHIEEESEEKIFNGAVDAAHAFLSTILGVYVAYIKLPWIRFGEFYLSIISLLQAAALILMSRAHHLYFTYGGYIIFQTLFQVMIIIVTSEVAEGTAPECEAFVFGINTLLALCIQTILTLTVVSEYGFVLNIREEILVYGIYSCLLGILFLVIAIQGRRKLFSLSSTSKSFSYPMEPAKASAINKRKESIASI